ncbi:hypothetical protein ACFVSN_30075 [Kitasatospora sp. NPDC057904]|uniref:hypothetical protein n=1 Tax=Kitasatospora sp. NPDC057904 TaxID=3346275 RepID=UPI0036D94F7A
MHAPGTTAARPAAARDTPATAAVVPGALGPFTSFAVVGGLSGAADLVTGAGRGCALVGPLFSLAAIAVSVLAAAFIAW